MPVLALVLVAVSDPVSGQQPRVQQVQQVQALVWVRPSETLTSAAVAAAVIEALAIEQLEVETPMAGL